jgi:hypothetical protein
MLDVAGNDVVVISIGEEERDQNGPQGHTRSVRSMLIHMSENRIEDQRKERHRE